MTPGFFRQLFGRGETSKRFDAQYQAGEWSFLADLDELGRYSIIAGYCRRLGATSILDVGCGQGVLAGELKPLAFERYLGVDFSPEAVRAASATCGDTRTQFAVADAAAYRPEGRFDAIIFNECLYYLAKPADVLAAYASALTPRGRFIVSVHQTRHNERVWPLVDRVAATEDGVTVTNQAGTAWVVRLLAPR